MWRRREARVVGLVGRLKPASLSRLQLALRVVARGAAGRWRGVEAAQPWRVLPTGSSPYSPRVAKSIRRSVALARRLVSVCLESNIGS